jgi:hypothetical protein
VNALDLDPIHEEMISHQEEPTDFDVINVWIRDMHPVYQTATSEERSFYEPDQILVSIDTVIPIPIEEAWGMPTRVNFGTRSLGPTATTLPTAEAPGSPKAALISVITAI